MNTSRMIPVLLACFALQACGGGDDAFAADAPTATAAETARFPATFDGRGGRNGQIVASESVHPQAATCFLVQATVEAERPTSEFGATTTRLAIAATTDQATPWFRSALFFDLPQQAVLLDSASVGTERAVVALSRVARVEAGERVTFAAVAQGDDTSSLYSVTVHSATISAQEVHCVTV